MRSSHLPPSEKYSSPKGNSLKQSWSITSCLLRVSRQRSPPQQDTQPLVWAEEKHCLQSSQTFADLCSGVCHLETLRVSSACAFFSLPLHFLLQPVRQLLCCVCLDTCIEGKGHCSFCVKNPNPPCWIIPPSPCPSLLAASHWRIIHWKSAETVALWTPCKCT